MKSKGWHWKQFPIRHASEATPIPIAADAGVATVGVGDGRMIPLLIFDTSERPDVDDMVAAHYHLGAGDVQSGWSRTSRFSSESIRLILTVIKPSHCLMVIEFDVSRQGVLVDQIVRSQGVYIMPGRPGDRLRTKIDAQKILVEVPSKEFQSEWDTIFKKGVLRRFRSEGMSRGDAKRATAYFIDEFRKVTSLRMKGPS